MTSAGVPAAFAALTQSSRPRERQAQTVVEIDPTSAGNVRKDKSASQAEATQPKPSSAAHGKGLKSGQYQNWRNAFAELLACKKA
eukprot:symbB.v1.2.015742.t1/scaffold1123.1/size136624/7